MIEATGVMHVKVIRKDACSPYKAHAVLEGGDIIEVTRSLLSNAVDAELTPLGDGRYILDKYLLTPLTLCDNINKSIFFKVTSRGGL